MEDYRNERWHRLVEIGKAQYNFENFNKKTTSMEDNLNKISGNQHGGLDSNCMSFPAMPKSVIQLLILAKPTLQIRVWALHSSAPACFHLISTYAAQPTQPSGNSFFLTNFY